MYFIHFSFLCVFRWYKIVTVLFSVLCLLKSYLMTSEFLASSVFSLWKIFREPSLLCHVPLLPQQNLSMKSAIQLVPAWKFNLFIMIHVLKGTRMCLLLFIYWLLPVSGARTITENVTHYIMIYKNIENSPRSYGA